MPQSISVVEQSQAHSHLLSKSMSVCVQSLQSCPTLCDPMDHSPPGSSVHGIFQARILEWMENSVEIPSKTGNRQAEFLIAFRMEEREAVILIRDGK